MYNEIVAVLPTNKSMVFLRVREGGVKYYLNELPYYLENTRCVLAPMNVQFSRDKQSANKIGFVTTPKSNYNINIRSEAGTFTIDSDSMKIHASIKENLSGQFSTILRHYYNREFIDSTIAPNYFKRCSDKPGSYSVSLKRTTNTKIFPFKQSYISDFTIPLKKTNEIDLTDWFSFLWTKNTFVKEPTNDYFTDFQYTDIYNYLFDFKFNVDVLNLELFNKKFSNEFFEVTSNLVKQSEHAYLLSVSVKCKKDLIPYQNRSLLFEMASIMDQMNNLKLQYKAL
jgi:hypothetical protein